MGGKDSTNEIIVARMLRERFEILLSKKLEVLLLYLISVLLAGEMFLWRSRPLSLPLATAAAATTK